MALSRKEMHRRGYKDDDIELASKVSSNEHRLGFAPDGGPPRSVGQRYSESTAPDGARLTL